MDIQHQTIPVWRQMLGALSGILKKADEAGMGDAVLNAALAEDMHPLGVQIRFVCNMPGEAMVRLGGITYESSEETPTTLAEAQVRIAQAQAEISEWEGADFVAGDAPIALELPNGMAFDLTAEEYVRDWALPQFYFHVTTAYAILRKEGLAIGKADYVPHMFTYMRKAGV